MTRTAWLLLLALVCIACDPEPDDPATDAGTADAAIDSGADSGADSGVTDDPDATTATCDCCGTTVGAPDGGSCLSGICDNWCGHVIPCDDSCDRTTHICVFTYGGADAGPTPDGGTPGPLGIDECVPRPSACDDLANCGGPTPDPGCDMSHPCFEALECVPNRVLHRGYLVQCRGA